MLRQTPTAIARGLILVFVGALCGCDGRPAPPPVEHALPTSGIFHGDWFAKTNLRYRVQHAFGEEPILSVPTNASMAFRGITAMGRSLSAERVDATGGCDRVTFQISMTDINCALVSSERDGALPTTELLERKPHVSHSDQR